LNRCLAPSRVHVRGGDDGGDRAGYSIADDDIDRRPLHEREEWNPYGNLNEKWEDGPSSWEEYGHDNDPSVCGLPVLTVEEWERGKYWEGGRSVLGRTLRPPPSDLARRHCRRCSRRK